MKKYIKYILGSFDNASRDKRELSVVSKFDCEVMVCDFSTHEGVKVIDGYTVYRRRKQLSRNSLIRKLQIISTWFFKEPKYLRQQQADYISCHDLVALFIGWLSTWFIFKEKKPVLIYDAHEFEIGRNTKRNFLIKMIIPRIEKFLMKKCAFSIMVNDSIADEVQKIYQLKERSIVVRNIPNYWNIDESVCEKRKKEFYEKLDISKDIFLLMYHGGIMEGRGIEGLLKAVQISKNTAVVILGYGKLEYKEKLKKLAEELEISERVLFHEAVPLDVLWQYAGAADVGVTLAPNTCLNHYYMLPNKLFENIQSLTPIIGSDFPEIRKIIKEYDIGLLVDSENTDEIAKAIEVMRTNKQLYNRFKKNLKFAKEDLCWENEAKILEEAYGEILG